MFNSAMQFTIGAIHDYNTLRKFNALTVFKSVISLRPLQRDVVILQTPFSALEIYIHDFCILIHI